MSKQPWLRFYGADWRGDANLRAVGYAARGLWMDMLTLMHEASPYGHLVVNGQPLDAARLAARLGGSAKEVQALLDRLEVEGVFSRNQDGVIFSRRMQRDADKAERDRLNGKAGGNPHLKGEAKDKARDNSGGGGSDNGGVNPQDKAHARDPLPEAREERTLTDVSDAKAASAAPPTPRDMVWTQGVPLLSAMTGKPPNACRSLLGKMLRDLDDDCPRLLMVLQQAQEARHIDPLSWLTAATRGKSEQRENPAERRIRERNEAMLRLAAEPGDLPFIDHEPQHRRLQ